MKTTEINQKIADDTLNLLASENLLRKSIVLSLSSERYIEVWWKEPADFKEEKPNDYWCA